jgi:arsenate reductase
MIYLHNPRCSKSREGLKILEDKKCKFEIREYLKDPLNAKEVLDLLNKLVNDPQQLIRVKEDDFKKSKLDLNDLNSKNIANAIAKFPVLLERPILINGKKAIIGRPPEDLLKIL